MYGDHCTTKTAYQQLNTLFSSLLYALDIIHCVHAQGVKQLINQVSERLISITNPSKLSKNRLHYVLSRLAKPTSIHLYWPHLSTVLTVPSGHAHNLAQYYRSS